MRRLCFFLFIILGVSQIHAQEMRFGVKGGVNFTDVTGNELYHKAGFTAYHIGVLMEIPLIKNLALQPELVYSLQGSQKRESFVDGLDTKADFHYLNVPIVAKYYAIDGFSFNAGPQIGVLMSANQESTVHSYIHGMVTRKGSIKNNMSPIDVAITMGAEYRFAFGVLIQVRYNIGVTNIKKSSSEQIIDASIHNRSMYNRVFQLSAGYSF